MKKFKERKNRRVKKEPALNVFLHLISAKRQSRSINRRRIKGSLKTYTHHVMTFSNILKQILQQKKSVTTLHINMGLNFFQQTQIMQERKDETER
jgi:hypothetical protein